MKLRNPGITTIIPSLKKLESPVIEGISVVVSHFWILGEKLARFDVF